MSLSSLRGVLFDMDGVIVDSGAEVERFWQRWADRYDRALSADDFVQLHGMPARQTIARFFADLPAADRQAILDESDRFDLEVTYTPLPGVLDFIARLQTNRIPTAMVTSALPAKAQATLRQFDLRFGSVVTADRIQHGKPAPDPYLLAARELGVPAEHCVVFEDSVSGTRAGVAAGATVVAINAAAYAPALRAAGARTVVPNFNPLRVRFSEGCLHLAWPEGA